MDLQELIASKGVSQIELASVLNCSESQVSLLVNGKRRMTVDVAYTIAKKINVSTDEIFFALNLTKRKIEQGA